MNLVELLYSGVQKFENKDAIRYKQDGQYQSITYRQLWDYITQFAAGLRAHNVNAGDKVAILSENCPEWVISDFAILGLGAVSVPIFPTLPADQVGFILQNADATHVIVENPEQLEKVQQVWAEPLQKAIVINGRASSADGRICTFSDVLSAGSRATNAASPFNMHAIEDGHLATIVHTSGTSGLPKGVMLSHRNIVTNVQSALTVLPVEADDVTLSYLPLSHIFERTVEEYALLSTGATVVYSEGIDFIQQNLQEVRPTILVSVPRLLEKVYSRVQGQLEEAPKPVRGLLMSGIRGSKNSGLSYRLADRLVFKKLRAGLGGRIRAVVSGGAGLAGEIASFYIKAGIPIYEGYGMTEAAPVIAANPFGASRPGTVGKAIPGVEVRTAEDGELLVRGPNVMLGYYKQVEETANTISPDGWLHTGDIGEILPDGYIRLVDRKKNILVLATGKNVAPFPIENAISLSPYISEAILVGDSLKYVSALVVPDFEALKPMATELGLTSDTATWVTRPEIRNLMQKEVSKAVARFAEFEQPKRFALLPHELTIEGGDITPSLKVRMKVIREKYGHVIEGIYSGSDYIPVGTDEPMPTAGATLPPLGGGGGNIPEGAITPGNFRAASAPPGALTPSSYRAPATGTASAAVVTTKRRSPVKYVIGGVIVLIILVAVASTAMHGRLNVKMPAEANLNGEIAAIGKNNDKISAVNDNIVGTMQQVNNLAGLTGQIGSSLGTLKSGVNHQAQLLGQLNDLSQQQVNLSQKLKHLSQVLTGSLSTIDSSAVQENGSVQQMAQSANQLATLANQLLNSNQQSAGKLAEAKSDAEQIASEMP